MWQNGPLRRRAYGVWQNLLCSGRSKAITCPASGVLCIRRARRPTQKRASRAVADSSRKHERWPRTLPQLCSFKRRARDGHTVGHARHHGDDHTADAALCGHSGGHQVVSGFIVHAARGHDRNHDGHGLLGRARARRCQGAARRAPRWPVKCAASRTPAENEQSEGRSTYRRAFASTSPCSIAAVLR